MTEEVIHRVEVTNRNGLHARPASQLVELASRFDSQISIKTDRMEVDAKSVLGIISLAAAQGTILDLRAQGVDAAEAMAALEGLFARGFEGE